MTTKDKLEFAQEAAHQAQTMLEYYKVQVLEQQMKLRIAQQMVSEFEAELAATKAPDGWSQAATTIKNADAARSPFITDAIAAPVQPIFPAETSSQLDKVYDYKGDLTCDE